MKKTLTIIAAVCLSGFLGLAMVGCSGVGAYNGLNRKSQTVDAKWGDVQGSYQRRCDLIPNLVETVKGASGFERSTLVGIAEARSRVGSIHLDKAPAAEEEVQKFAAAQQGLGTALSRLMMVTEQYPQLRATDAFRDLQAQIEGTENRINVARRDYNDAVREYNTAVGNFPGSLVAGFSGFKSKPYFKVESEEASKAPKINFSSK